MEAFDPADFDQAPTPPPILYKYLSIERIGNVLDDRTVRFTQLLDTNDTFEVRSTFERMAGPKMLSMFAEELDKSLSEESIRKLTAEALKRNGLGFLPTDLALKIVAQHYGENYIDVMRAQMQQTVDTEFVPFLNDPDNSSKMLDKFARSMLCFSLSERMDSPVMWAHYADQNAGFIVAFDTSNSWFRNRVDGSTIRLQKVTYFDGKLAEILDNPQAALISKTTDWSYEREWRLYIKDGEADRIIKTDAEPIHLLNFPPEAVNRVILGPKMRPEIASRIKEIVALRMPEAKVTRTSPNHSSHTYDETDL